MGKKLVLGVLIAIAAFSIAVAAVAAVEWWQGRGNTASRVVAAPATPVAEAPTTAMSDPVTMALEVTEAPRMAEVDTRRETEQVAQQASEPAVTTTTLRHGEGEDAAPTGFPAAAPAVTTTTLHPQVQAQGMERVVAIIEGHSDSWPWVALALDVAQMSFFEDLPSECDSAIGCYNHATGDIWLTLDALREPDAGSFAYFFDRRSPSDIVLHELAHAYTRSFPQGSELFDVFGQHYAGCSGRGLDSPQLVAELLADTMAMVVTMAGSSLPEDYGYFGSGGFTGCLAESSQPDTALVEAVYSSLFNCDSTHALDAFADHHDLLHTGPIFGRDFDADAVLLLCYGIDCTGAAAIDLRPNRGCENVTETDERRDIAQERLKERQCADGLLHPSFGLERRGWETGCEDFVPDDVECIVTDFGYRPGLLDVSGECIVPTCTVDDARGESQPGYTKSFTFECIPIDRPASEKSDTNDSPSEVAGATTEVRSS